MANIIPASQARIRQGLLLASLEVSKACFSLALEIRDDVGTREATFLRKLSEPSAIKTSFKKSGLVLGETAGAARVTIVDLDPAERTPVLKKVLPRKACLITR